MEPWKRTWIVTAIIIVLVCAFSVGLYFLHKDDLSHLRLCKNLHMAVFEFARPVQALKHAAGFILALDDDDLQGAEKLGMILRHLTATRRPFAYDIAARIRELQTHINQRYCIKKKVQTTTTSVSP